ncbi:MAG: hypothetical protein ACRDYF_17270 [Acidimicrobiia bacterium]
MRPAPADPVRKTLRRARRHLGAKGESFKGARTAGTFEVTSIEGDWVSKPLTKAHAVFKNIVVKR